MYILDAIGCGIFRAQVPLGQVGGEIWKRQRGTSGSTVWCSDHNSPAAWVARALGVAIHSFDYDDYHDAEVHLGYLVVLAALCLGERDGVSGGKPPASVAAGYEVVMRVNLGTGSIASRKGAGI